MAERRRTTSWSKGIALMAVLLVAAACTNSSKETGEAEADANGAAAPSSAGSAAGDGGLFRISLSEGSPYLAATSTQESDGPRVVGGEPLADPAVAAIIERLTPWKDADPELERSFAWPPQGALAPPAGAKVIDQPFPPTDGTGENAPPDVPVGPVKVLRVQPEGAVDVAPHVTITFDQPMVPLASLGQLDEIDVPVRITPAVEGRWQWIGTRTLRFDRSRAGAAGNDPTGNDPVGVEPDRLPMATEYSVEIPATMRSASGSELGSAKTFTFSTPAAAVGSIEPSGPGLALQPVFVATFNQQVEPQEILEVTTLTDDDASVSLRLATAAEIEADEAAKRLVKAAGMKRSVAFIPTEPLSVDTAITVEIGPQIPSAEGPLAGAESKRVVGRTYGPLKVTRHDCESGPNCIPGSGIVLTLSNPLDLESFDPAAVTVEPALVGKRVLAADNRIIVYGATRAKTTYEITVPAALRDIHGQRLGSDHVQSVTIGSATQMLEAFPNVLTTLDPTAGTPKLEIGSVNHDDFRVKVFDVTPQDLIGFQDYMARSAGGADSAAPLPQWKTLVDTVVQTSGKTDELVETELDLADAFDTEFGHVIVLVEPTKLPPPFSDESWQNRRSLTWVQATGLAVDGFRDNDEVAVWVTALADGTVVDDASVQAISDAGLANVPGTTDTTTDGDGLARLSLPTAAPDGTGGFRAIVATKGTDSAILPSDSWYQGTWARYPAVDQLVWYVADDRGLYRPGETASVKGWIRNLTTSSDGRLRFFGGATNVTYTLNDALGVVLATGEAPIGPLGGFDLSLDIPDTANLGGAALTILAGQGTADAPWNGFTHQIRIDEFRRPEFEVSTRAESPAPYFALAPLTVAVDATYFSGGPLGGAPVSWSVSRSKATYHPPGWDDFTFGVWTPWWVSSDPFSREGFFGDEWHSGPFPEQPDQVETFEGITDAAGHHFLQVDFDGDVGRPDLPISVRAESNVTDVNRQAWASSTDLVVHPGQLTVGLRGTATFVRSGEPLTVEAIVTDIDGEAVAQDLTITAGRVEGAFKDGEWVEEVVDTQTCEVASAARPVSCTFETDVAGTYRISSTVTDEDGGRSRSELTRWVTGAVDTPQRTIEAGSLQVIPDKVSYAPGDIAELLVQSPISGTGLAVIARNGISRTQRFEVVDGSAVLAIDVGESDVPNLVVGIEVVGSTSRTDNDGEPVSDDAPRPAYATGGVRLTVSVASRQLTVTATPRDATVAPGGSTEVDVVVSDADGTPVAGSEVALMIVDEAVLSLTDHQLVDPLEVFYRPLPGGVESRYGRSHLRLQEPPAGEGEDLNNGIATPTTIPASGRDAVGGAPSDGVAESSGEEASFSDTGSTQAFAAVKRGSAGGGATSPIPERTRFDALALFSPAVTTAADGTAAVPVTVPDSLTRYRIMAVAVHGEDRFGSTSAALTAQLPVMVRPSAPRFANFGDSFEFPVVVQNGTDEARTVDVVLQSTNLVVTGARGVRVEVPANERVEVRFPVEAASVGTARFRVAAVSEDSADAAVGEFPVYNPATAEAFATYGVLDDGAAAQPYVAPTDVFPEFGALEITTSSTALQALTDAVISLSEGRYDTVDTHATRILAIAALRPVLAAFEADGLAPPAELDEAVEEGIEEIAKAQQPDGGFSYWRSDPKSDPYLSLTATHALAAARNAGYTVPEPTLAMALAYVTEIRLKLDSANFSEEAHDSLEAYSLWIRNEAGQRDEAAARALWDRRGTRLPLDSMAWLWPVLETAGGPRTPEGDAIALAFDNRAVETAGAAHFATSYTEAGHLVLPSNHRTDALVLDALVQLRPENPLIPKVVNGLLGAQTNGRWGNALSDTFVLVSMHRYFEAFETQAPSFTANLWLGDLFAGAQTFSGRTTDQARLDIPMRALIEAGDGNLVLAKEGTGRLYYRLGLRYAPKNLKLEPLDRGFVVERTYEAVDDAADVTRDEDGTWSIKAGALVRVRLSMVAESTRANVVLFDPLPAGLEIVNPDLATSPTVPDGPQDPDTPSEDFGWWWRWTWYDHQAMRDDRAEAYAGYLMAGSYDYSYVARATTPGTFVAPPSRAEERYAPETFGRSGTDRVVIDG